MTGLNKILALGAASVAALSLAACNDAAKKPADQAALLDTSASAELPPAKPAPVAPRPPQRAYAWAERAYGMQQSVYETPPDYGFEYEGVEPLVWETADDWSMYAEPWEDSYRYYYYEPGAAYPYFVRDRDYGYGYDPRGELVAVFDSGGRYLPDETLVRMAPVAGRYFERGRELRRVGLQAPRAPVAEQTWSSAAPRISRTADPWLRAARSEAEWQAWRDRDGNRELQRFRAEQQRREALQRTALERQQDLQREQAAGLVRSQQMAADQQRLRGADADRRFAEQQRLQDQRRFEDQRRLADQQRLAQYNRGDMIRAQAADQHARDVAARAQADARRQQMLDRQRDHDEQARLAAQQQLDRQHDLADRQRSREAQMRATQAVQAERRQQQQMAERQREQAVQAQRQQLAERQRAHEDQVRAVQAQRAQAERAQAQEQRAQQQRAQQQQARAAEQQQREQQRAQAAQARAAEQQQQRQQQQAQQQQQRQQQQAEQQQARAAEQAARQAAAREHAQQGAAHGEKDKRRNPDERP
jgi:hypothetical protein